MTQIARVYDNSSEAAEAVNELKTRGLADIAVLSAPQDNSPEATSADDIARAIRKAGLPASSAESYAGRVMRGGAVVIVNAPFGAGAKATEILERHGSTEPRAPDAPQTNVSQQRSPTETDATAAPLSAALHIPVLADSTPSSSLTAPRTLSSILGIPELIQSGSSFPLLTQSQAPFSSLSKSQEPFSSLSGYQRGRAKLSSNQNGHATLINNPTPLSSLLGLPVLIGALEDEPTAPTEDTTAPAQTAEGAAPRNGDPAPSTAPSLDDMASSELMKISENADGYKG